MNARFVPPHPPRAAGPVPVWRGFFGERARTSVHGWSQRAFEIPHMRRTIFGHRVHIPLQPDMVQRVLLDNAANYVKPDLVKRLLAPMIGRGLLTSDGDLWRSQRKIVAATFAPAAVDALTPLFADAAERIGERWQPGTVDMHAAATATTMQVIAAALFGGNPLLVTDAATAHIATALEGVSEARLQVLLGLPLLPWSRRGRRAGRSRTFLRETLSEVVRARMAAPPADDFLGRLIGALSAQFAPEEAFALAVDNAATFYLAGHETTANAITWTLFLLSEQPELQDQAAVEAIAALGSGGSADLPDRLPLLRRIVDETLRLYPPAPRFDRQAVAADRLGEHEVEPGDLISIWPWIIHRHRDLWDDPDAFDPERMRPEAKVTRHRFQYLPFGGGPRVCVGARFSIAEALTIVAHWLARWRFDPLPGREVPIKPPRRRPGHRRCAARAPRVRYNPPRSAPRP